ncbi:integrase catalytic domain-containing protein [Trichonephila clavipes]|uniref:Integrase catalytic domain-containing protein n=1 Tax=Trichonephila clavipes TaxID=2585209 RepID=A0A8X7BDZ7_TRICX|nr:integrase catalytic domain-containing protein [Trichonephila clavipes]
MANAKFELRGWEFTDSNGSISQPEISKVLGMLWNRKNDTLSCEVDLSIEMTEPFTRRKLLSIAQRIFDPIGFCCPVILYPNLLLQESWKAKFSWDDELPKDVTEKFKKWFKNLHRLKLVEIPRYVSMNSCVSINLHIFCDASKLSYATAIFLRSESESQVSVQLVLAKSRIVPLKAMSIPKLELMTCIIGVRFTDMVKRL